MQTLTFLESVVDMGLMKLPVSSPIVTMPGKTLLISPGSRLTEAQLRSIPTEVTDVVATNMGHAAGIENAMKVFPKARCWASRGGRKAKPKLPFTDELGPESEFGSDLACIHLEGMPKLGETVFVHRPTKTLLVSDLCFNFPPMKGLGANAFLTLSGTRKGFAVSRLFGLFVKDKPAFQRSLALLLTHDFERIAVSHGTMIERDGKARLTEALRERGYQFS
jgi:hypothetical protein